MARNETQRGRSSLSSLSTTPPWQECTQTTAMPRMLASGVPNEAISGLEFTAIDLFFRDRVPPRPSQRVILGLSPGSQHVMCVDFLFV